MSKTEKMYVRVTAEMMRELETMAAEKCLTKSSLIATYVSQGLYNDRKMKELLSAETLHMVLNKQAHN